MADNGRIMRNTLFLAVRMPMVLLVGLLTSRVVLEQLGTVDFGVYQVVAGFIMLMAFINSAMTMSIQRFMNVEMVKSEGADMQTVFAASCKCVLFASFGFLIAAESIGIWLIECVLSIPADRHLAAMAVYQLTLLTTIIEFFRIPYTSQLVAYEKMQFYAYYTIIDCIGKLAVAYALVLIAGNRLIWYAVMLVGVSVVLSIFLVLYSRHYFKGTHFSFKAPMSRVREITGFVGWTTLASGSSLVYQQGGNIILNIFYGVTLNATMGIVNQVKGGVTALARNLMLASSPQIIKSYNAGDRRDFESLFTRTTRLLYYIVLLFGLPVMLNTDFILNIWLANVPPMADIFLIWMVIYCLVEVSAGPLDTAIYACGRMGWYQIMQGAMSVVYLVALYVAYRFGAPAQWVIVLLAIVNAVVLVMRFTFVHYYCDLSPGCYLRDSILPMLAVTVLTAAPSFAVAYYTPAGSALRFWTTCSTAVVATLLAVYAVGLKGGERKKVTGKVRKLLHLSSR